jgi:hypothetical protein
VTPLTPLSIHDSAALAEYFDRRLKPSKWKTGFKSIDSIAKLDVAIDVGPVKVHRLTELVRDLTLEPRLNFATLKWLRPHEPTMKLSELAGLGELAGLDHLHAADFATRLIHRSTELMRQHPLLANWVLHRNAALEFVARPPKASVPEELVDWELQLRHALMRAHLLARSSRGIAANAAARVMRHAMEAAAIAVAKALGAENSGISANLMVPVSGAAEWMPNEDTRRNAERALALWEGLDSAHRLLIVAQTAGVEHLGFWVPVARAQRGGLWLPGAPTAYRHGQGDAVFKEDLPPLSGFPDAVATRWKAYMFGHFAQRMFVSLPFVAPRGGPGGARMVVSVLNVNVEASDLSGWRRASHPEWLKVARDRSRPFAEIAFEALVVMLAESGADAPVLNTGSVEFDSLPGLAKKGLLK